MKKFAPIVLAGGLASLLLSGCFSTGTELAVGETWILPELTT